MGNRKHEEGAQALSAFVAQLTAADELSKYERNTSAQQLKTDARSCLMRLGRLAELAFHEASAAKVRVSLSWDANHANPAARRSYKANEAEHLARARALIAAVDSMVAAQPLTSADVKAKAVAVNRYIGAASGNSEGLTEWRAKVSEWRETLTAQAAAFRTTVKVEA